MCSWNFNHIKIIDCNGKMWILSKKYVYKIWSFLFTRQGKINPIMKNRVRIGYRKRVTVLDSWVDALKVNLLHRFPEFLLVNIFRKLAHPNDNGRNCNISLVDFTKIVIKRYLTVGRHLCIGTSLLACGPYISKQIINVLMVSYRYNHPFSFTVNYGGHWTENIPSLVGFKSLHH